MTDRVLYDSHMHTPLCRHASGEPELYAAHAERRGLAGIIFTCHNPLPDGIAQGSRMYLEQFDQYKAMIARAAEQFAGRVDVRLGIEADFIPGIPGLPVFLEKQLGENPFNHVLGSVHPQVGEYQQLHNTGDPVAYQRTYFTHLAEAAETGLFDTLSHPDLVKNIAPDHWRFDRLIDHVSHCLDRIARTGMAMELNTSGLQKAIPEFNPNTTMLQLMHARRIPVVLGSDSHVPTRVAANFEDAMDVLAGVGYTHVSFFLDRKRRDVNGSIRNNCRCWYRNYHRSWYHRGWCS